MEAIKSSKEIMKNVVNRKEIVRNRERLSQMVTVRYCVKEKKIMREVGLKKEAKRNAERMKNRKVRKSLPRYKWLVKFVRI